MRCPYCGADNTQVKETRPSEDGAAIRRRRSCNVCGGRFTTFERVVLRELMVLKRSGKREPFDREKLERSVSIAARKRNIGEDALSQMVSGIQRQLESSGDNEVSADLIGGMVMEALRSIDDVAFVRFASVYRNFSTAKDFEAFVAELAETVSARQAYSSGKPDPD